MTDHPCYQCGKPTPFTPLLPGETGWAVPMCAECLRDIDEADKRMEKEEEETAHHNTCVACGIPTSCKGGIKIRSANEAFTACTVILCDACGDKARGRVMVWIDEIRLDDCKD